MAESYLWAFFSSLCASILIVVLFYFLTMQVFADEHRFLLEKSRIYGEYSRWQRFLFILLRARILSRIVLIIALVGLYHGALFLGRDLQIGWSLYAWALSQ